MPNVVLDANTIVSAALKQDSVPERAVLLASVYDTIHLSEPVLEETRGVLLRPRLRRFITDERREAILRVLLADAPFIEPTTAVTDCRDRKDNKYLELALAAGAEVIVSGDPDLLTLDPWRGVRIMRPAEYVAQIEAREGLALSRP